MGRIGLFGGTFDPPHKGHIELSEAALKEFCLDKIIFIPAGNPPHKTNKKITDKHHRYEMIRLATSDNPCFLVSDYDIKNEKPNYSYLTINHFLTLYPDDEIFFIVGEDSYKDLPLWKNYPQILSLCTFIVINRPDVKSVDCYKTYKDAMPDHKALFLSDFSYDVSSTKLREDIAAGNLTCHNLPQCVMEYIKNNNLYTKESL